MNKNRILVAGVFIGAFIAGAICFLIFQIKHLKTHKEYQVRSNVRQVELIDSMRRSDLGSLMSNVLDKIDDELKQNPNGILSEATINRIAAACYAFKPYAYAKGDSVSTKKLSPERGRLLLMLSSMDIDSTTLFKIFDTADFSDADLREADLKGAMLKGVNLNGADLHSANLEGSNLSFAKLRLANLWGANLNRANMRSAELKRADLRWAELNGTNLIKADLHESDLNDSKFRKADLQEANLQWTVFNGAIMNEANLLGADMFRTDMEKTQLAGANLSKVNLTLGDLRGADLTNANLTGANLSDLYVAEQNWLSLLSKHHVTGAAEIQKKYIITIEHTADHVLYKLKEVKSEK